ncbi:hypothetical protein BKA62DRAFT_740283 [Auriculariales sp. MPI-PUGE-AT-0066]|nr:hypothetical protein BKA62DRAFT_740283 [Auriculariales sp. MPI-PUGE-AT-0066]
MMIAAVVLLLVFMNLFGSENVSNRVGSLVPQIWGAGSTGQSLETGPIAITLVMIGLESAKEGQHMIKSIFMRTSRDIDLHIICTSDVIPFLQSKLDLVTRPVHDLSVTFYPITEADIDERSKRAGIGSRHHAGVGGLVKMFLHEVLPVKYSLYVDTDAVFLSDPALLWAALVDMVHSDPRKIVAFSHAGDDTEDGLICTCVMALNLEAMRATPFMPSTLVPAWDASALGTAATWKAQNVSTDMPTFGDQSFYWGLWRANRDRFYRLSRSWDISACRNFYRISLNGVQDISKSDEASMQTTTGDLSDAEEGFLFPGIVHFNCQARHVSPFDNLELRANPGWGALLVFAAQYRWVWLNQYTPGTWLPYGTAAPAMHTKVTSLRFLDERMAAAGFDTRR